MSVKKLLGAFLLFLLAAGLSAQGHSLVVPSWKWKIGDSAAWAQADLDDSGWTQAAQGERLDIGATRRVFWIRTRVDQVSLGSLASAAASGRGLWFVSDRGGLVFDLYINGAYSGSRGNLEPRYDVRRSITETYQVPATALSGGEGFVLALRCVYDGRSLSMPSFLLADSGYVRGQIDKRNFWNGGIYTMLGALCFFLGFYFAVLFLSRRSAVENIYFAVSSLLMAAYFYEMGASYLPFGSPLVRALTRGALPSSLVFLAIFFSTFFKYKDSRPLRLGGSALALLLLGVFVAFKDDEVSLTLLFNIGLLVVFASIAFGLVAAVKAVRRGAREAIPPLIAIAVGCGFVGHDVYYQVSGRDPFAWLQGLAIFALNAAIFISLTMRQVKLSSDFERLSVDLQARGRELEASLGRIGRASEEVAGIGQELGRAVDSVSLAVERSGQRVGEVDGEAKKLAERASEADSLVADFLDSIAKVNERLSAQSSDIERTAGSANELSADIASAASHIERTAEFAARLASLTGEGEQAAQSLKGTMERVAEATRGIREIVDAVNEFAERTNLLAMNAAIEAAHSGAAGRGFAIIAGEVKGLAASQSERAAKIAELADEINRRTGEGSAAAAQLSASLRSIAEGAGTAASSIAEVKAGTLEEAGESSKVRDSMLSISGAVAAIEEESRRQSGYSAKVRDAVSSMASSAADSKASAEAIASESGEIAREVERLRSLVAKSIALTEELEGLRSGGPSEGA